MNGVSGGPVWSFDRRALLEGTNENVKLIGIVNEKDSLVKAIWGPRMALVMESMALEIPELSKAIPRPNNLFLRSY